MQQALTLDQCREMLYHAADQAGPDQIAEMLIDYLNEVVGKENLTEFQQDLANTLDAVLTKHCGARQ